MKDSLTTILEFDSPERANELFGPQNQNLALISGICGITLNSRGNSLSIAAKNREDLQNVSNLLAQLYEMLTQGRRLSPEDISSACSMFKKSPGLDLGQILHKQPSLAGLRRQISARTLNQQSYLNALEHSEMVFAIGPAGTGKTYLAVAAAVAALNARKVKRIVLTRPAVEAGEKLGYLPGDLAEKVNPYLRPLYD
ncbi:MAG: PhoH family protein, partial [Desulfovibrionaceae bacterium]|nr:PhoH family protein [Desulfovibrionaceae bacterium]